MLTRSKDDSYGVRTRVTRPAEQRNEKHEDETALLATTNPTTDTTDEEEEEQVEAEIKGYRAHTSPASRPWVEKIPVRLRTVLFSILSLSVLVSLFLFFHPSKPPVGISHDAASYYSGAPLSIGLFDPSSAQLAGNPLDPDATFADVPFAKVGDSWDRNGWKPEWAGGDAGSKQGETGGHGKYWNGTNWFDRTVVLVTIEGLNTRYISSDSSPNLLELAKQGFQVDSLKPVFPTLSAPNHWSILTGLYPASHGIVSNRFTNARNGQSGDKVFDAETDAMDTAVWDEVWYDGEPIYQTALKAKLKVATLMHPLIPTHLSGSGPSKPTYWYPPIPKTHPRKKLAKILSFLDQSYNKRPQLIVTNFDELSVQAMKKGTRDQGVTKGLRMIDESFFGDLRRGLEDRGLHEWVEIVVVGVTGMEDVDRDKVVLLDELLDSETWGKLSSTEPFDGGSSVAVGLRTDAFEEESVAYAKLMEQLTNASNQGRGRFDVYTKDDLPSEWHFSSLENDRIAPIWLVAKEGSTISTRDQMEEMGGKLGFKAANGYVSDNMNSLFLSSGPISRKLERKAASFSNLEVYDFIATALGLASESRALNNGTQGFWPDP